MSKRSRARDALQQAYLLQVWAAERLFEEYPIDLDDPEVMARMLDQRDRYR